MYMYMCVCVCVCGDCDIVQEKDEKPPEFLQSLQITKTRAGMHVCTVDQTT